MSGPPSQREASDSKKMSVSQRVELLRKHLLAWRKALELTGNREDAFLAAMQDLLAFVRDYRDSEALAAFETTPDFKEIRSFLEPCVLRFTWAMERMTYADLMARPDPCGPIGPLLGPNIRGQYARMAELLNMVDFQSCRRLMEVGCGIMPSSLIFLYEYTGVPDLVGIDNNAEAASSARAITTKWGMTRIHIECADAADVSYEGFDIINWSPFANPRISIMRRILETARPGTTIILREPFAAGVLLFERTLPLLDPRFVVVAESEAFPGRFMLKHVILRLVSA